MKHLLLLFSLTLSLQVHSQIDEVVSNERELIDLYNKILRSEIDADRDKHNEDFKKLLSETLILDGSFEHPFDNIPTLSKLNTKNSTFRLITWNIQNDAGEHRYYGFAQLSAKSTRSKEIKVIELKNMKGELVSMENKSLNSEKWPGAVYYQMIENKKGKNTYYTLLGWRGIDNGLTQKIIEIVYLSGEDIKFGYPLIKVDNKNRRRLVFSYNAKTSMHLNYDEERKQFTFDHLAASSNLVIGNYRFYGPDGSYDALQWEKKYWKYINDIDAKNKADENDIFYNPVTQPDLD